MSAASAPSPFNPMPVRVVIPARNEEQTITPALDALRTQVDLSGHPIAPGCFDVTVLTNKGEDATANVTLEYAERHPDFPLRVLEQTVPAERATIGAARRRLIDDACARFDADGYDGIVATTNAHTIVAPDWIAATLVEFAHGADVVGGRIVLSAADLARMDLELRRMHLQDIGYHLMLAELGARVDPCPCDPSPCHHQHASASLAIRSNVYRQARTVTDRQLSDDAALYHALEQIDARVRHSPHVRATTTIQVPGAEDACPLSLHAGRPMLVESVTRSLRRLQLRRELRGRWRYRRSHQELAQGTRMDAFVFFGAFLADIHSEIEWYLNEAIGNEPIPLPRAIDDLRMTLAVERGSSARSH